jgi:protein-L-isoaspartate(D-aspartate) O-methyltransferase
MSALPKELPKEPAPDFATARFNMVESQIRPNKVRDNRVLNAFGKIPRENFVPMPMTGIAYIDNDIQVAGGRYLLEPMVLARLIEEAQIKPTDSVLDLACATGYSTAVIAALANTVVGVESDHGLHGQALSNIAALDIKNAEIHANTLTEGFATLAPYDVIIVNGAVDVVPDALTEQLAEQGRLMVVVRHFGPAKAAHTGEARLYEKINGHISFRSLFDANVKLLPGFAAPHKFTF